MAMAYQMPVYATLKYHQQEKWIQHYSSSQQILLVGEGDFSFSFCLAQAFGSASNIVASSLQSYDEVIEMYKNGELNIGKLQALGGTILYHVNATNIEGNSDLMNRKFDRIIFNFPHAGFRGYEDNIRVIQRHQNLVLEFFRSARERLWPDGEIHVTHKMDPPFHLWDLEGLASKNSLTCIERADFNIANYPGYHNKRGDYPNCDESFPLRQSCTFKFILDPSQNLQRARHLLVPSQEFQEIPNSLSPKIYPFQQHLSPNNRRNSPTFFNDMNAFSSYTDLPARHDATSKFLRLFKEYFSNIQENFGREEITVEVSVRQALERASLMYRAELERPSESYPDYVEMLRSWSISRVTRLRQIMEDHNWRPSEPQGMGYYLL